jgi:hypothetical protein
MKKYFLIALLTATALTTGAYSQAPVRDSSAAAADTSWKSTMIAHLNLTQVSFTDWAQGGQNAFSYTAGIEGRSVMNTETSNWDNEYKFAFGQARLATQGLRKADDKIDLASVYTYKIDSSWINPYGSATLKTQFAKGYMYNDSGLATPVSKFFDPGYLQQSVGAGFHPIKEVKIRLGTGLREIFTSEFPVYAEDPAHPNQKTSVEGGIEMVTDVHWEVDKNILLTSKIEMFDPYNTLTVIVVHGDNTVTCQVSKYIQVSLDVQFINEKNVMPETQYAETLAMGLTYNIF